ncbi:hypothetical protein L1D34_22250 [Vibrio mediterranei]|uniref:hypothetical protein n=1 Tax=Vibrio mediterranei TaxID=689 RepID=UPI001EFD9A82|nr:hypothetical protein [Vibrio mediterranei]MCG9627560.1 hypothetical protein [Vibrio mediterranei]
MQNESSTKKRISDSNLFILLCVLVVIALSIKFWPEVTQWNLGDNDNFLRLHQLQTFIATPSWYIRPLQDFNPQDGVIIHWSRLPDIPLLMVYYLTVIVFGDKAAMHLAITFVPLGYLLVIMIVWGKLTFELFGKPQAFLSLVFSSTSLAAAKCFPGQIDHHNIQLVMFSLFMYAFASPVIRQRPFIFLTSVSVSLSLAIGLEVLPFFILLLGVFCLVNINKQPEKLTWLRDTSLAIFVLGCIGVGIFYGSSQFSQPKYDVVSIGLLSYFLAASVVLTVVSHRATFITLFVAALVVFGPMLIWNSEPLRSPYADYPEILKNYWLNHVIEAEPLIDPLRWRETTITQKFTQQNVVYAVTILPALLSFFCLKSTTQRLLWGVFIATLLPALFWQVRTLAFSSLVAIPLQAALGYWLLSRINVPVLRLVLVLMISPMVAALTAQMFINQQHLDEKKLSDLERMQVVPFIQQQELPSSKVFAPMEQGAQILSLTDHSVITGPYHRNIRGNVLYLNVLLSDDMDRSHHILNGEQIDYVLFDASDRQIPYLKRDALTGSLVIRLLSRHPPDWMELVSSDGASLFLYKVK